MTKLEQIEESIASLSDDELRRLSTWFDELRWQRWDRQLDGDVAAGRLDRLVADARAEIAAGKTRPL
jgi:ABC-type phosphate transport system auxiliary subunit